MRKLATIRKIDSIDPIDGADKIEVASVGGWKIVVGKDIFKPNDVAVMFEIDSIVPIKPWSSFLDKGSKPKVQLHEGKEYTGYRLKTIKLKKQVSQGLLIPLGECFTQEEIAAQGIGLGSDVSDHLGIVKWDPPVPAQLAGKVRGNFPSFIPKTDEERIQNLGDLLAIHKDAEVYVTEKLDGTSFTIANYNGEIHVCSRNMDLFETEGNLYWQIAKKYGLDKLCLDNMVIQGEIVGYGVQNNPLRLPEQRLYIFNVYDIKTGKYYNYNELKGFCYGLRLPMVPVLDETVLGERTMEGWLNYADRMSVVTPTAFAEGVVIRAKDDMTHSVSLKAISNSYLLAQE
jgi:RNA ligase (TIGR02306 family)